MNFSRNFVKFDGFGHIRIFLTNQIQNPRWTPFLPIYTQHGMRDRLVSSLAAHTQARASTVRSLPHLTSPAALYSAAAADSSSSDRTCRLIPLYSL